MLRALGGGVGRTQRKPGQNFRERPWQATAHARGPVRSVGGVARGTAEAVSHSR